VKASWEGKDPMSALLEVRCWQFLHHGTKWKLAIMYYKKN
jgi:hypothetical protein